MTQPLWAEACSALFLLILLFGTLALAHRKEMRDALHDIYKSSPSYGHGAPMSEPKWGESLRDADRP